MIVVVAEKPSVGRDIARVLQCREKGDGFLRGEKYLVTWAIGHLVSLCEPDEMDEKYKKWRMEDLPILPESIPTKVLSPTKSQFSIVKKLMNDKETESLICATDAGREGELIFRLIYHQAKCTKPVQRLWISSMTDEAIRDGFASLKPSQEYDGLYRSAECRSKADWLVGMNASRAFTLRFDSLLSIGRVQTPTLAILVKRAKEISAFVPEDYYTLNVNFGDYSGQWFDPNIQDEKKSVRIADENAAKKIAGEVKGKQAVVQSINCEAKKEWPPSLYDLTSLQRDANRKYGFTADKTLKIAQELYEKWKAITYPRTDSKYLPMDMHQRTLQTLRRLPRETYAPLVQNIPLKNDQLPVTPRIFDDKKVSDHHALIPTPQTVALDKLPPDAAHLFDMIARRTIAVFYPPFEYDAIKVITGCEKHFFKSNGRVIKHNGWKDVYGADPDDLNAKSKKNGAEEDSVLPPLVQGDTRIIQKAAVKKETTKPPSPHNDASLLSAMENAGRELEDEALREQMKGSGLGTPATRAAIIERLIQVGYAERKKKAITATEKGIALVDIAPPEITSPETTGKWELALDKIARNEQDTVRFMQGIQNLTKFLVSYAQNPDNKAVFPEEFRRGTKGKRASAQSKNDNTVPDVACPLCGKQIIETDKAFGCQDWRNGCHFTIWKDCLTRGGGPVMNQKVIVLLLKNKSVRGSTGTIFLQDKFLQFVPNGQPQPSVNISIVYEKRDK